MDLLRRLNQLPNNIKPDDAQNRLNSMTLEYVRDHLPPDALVLIKTSEGKYWRALGAGISLYRSEAHPYPVEHALRYTSAYQSTFELP